MARWGLEVWVPLWRRGCQLDAGKSRGSWTERATNTAVDGTQRKRQISKATSEFYYRKREQSPGLERCHLWGKLPYRVRSGFFSVSNPSPVADRVPGQGCYLLRLSIPGVVGVWLGTDWGNVWGMGKAVWIVTGHHPSSAGVAKRTSPSVTETNIHTCAKKI